MFLTNALPASVLVDPTGSNQIMIRPVRPDEVAALWASGALESAIGHTDTAALVSAAIGHEVAECRQSIPPLAQEESLIAALYTGPRLPEGSKTLPEGAALTFYRVSRKAWHSCGDGGRLYEETR